MTTKLLFAVLACALALVVLNSTWVKAELIEPTRTLNKCSEPPGKISISSEPPGLEVFLDGKNIGKTPIFRSELNPGIHSIQIYETETEIIVYSKKHLQFSNFKGKTIAILVKENSNKKLKPVAKNKIAAKILADEKSEYKIEYQPFYWPMIPNGPIY